MMNTANPVKINGPIFDYMSFLAYMNELAEQRQTSGKVKSASRVEFTILNNSRLRRIDQHIHISDELMNEVIAIDRPQKWYVITESWCGDSAQVMPVIGKLSLYNFAMIELRIILRDENPEWMNFYHTKGALSIPKLVIRDSDENDIASWGPRPIPAQNIMEDWKAQAGKRSHDEFEIELHTWYAHDKTITVQMELLKTITSLSLPREKGQNGMLTNSARTFRA
ncbi:MAG: thioredoxin family protein [Bacteroidetes bacterium]|nr:thioredoxin family protein [Bacteroidota bacterium]